MRQLRDWRGTPTLRAAGALLAAAALLAPPAVVNAEAAPRPSGVEKGWCAKGQGITVVVDMSTVDQSIWAQEILDEGEGGILARCITDLSTVREAGDYEGSIVPALEAAGLDRQKSSIGGHEGFKYLGVENVHWGPGWYIGGAWLDPETGLPGGWCPSAPDFGDPSSQRCRDQQSKENRVDTIFYAMYTQREQNGPETGPYPRPAFAPQFMTNPGGDEDGGSGDGGDPGDTGHPSGGENTGDTQRPEPQQPAETGEPTQGGEESATPTPRGTPSQTPTHTPSPQPTPSDEPSEQLWGPDATSEPLPTTAARRTSRIWPWVLGVAGLAGVATLGWALLRRRNSGAVSPRETRGIDEEPW